MTLVTDPAGDRWRRWPGESLLAQLFLLLLAFSWFAMMAFLGEFLFQLKEGCLTDVLQMCFSQLEFLLVLLINWY